MILTLHPGELRQELARVTWWLVGLAILLDVTPRALQAARWKYLLGPIGLSYRFILEAIYVGTLYSGVLPLSSGDAVRGVMVARQARTSTTFVFSTELVERMADAMALVLVVWFTLRGLVLPSALRFVLATLEVLIAAALIIGFVLGVRRKSLESRVLSFRPVNRIARWSQSIGLKVLAAADRFTVTGLLVSISTALGIVVLRVGVLYLLLVAYHIHLSFLHAAALFAIIMIGTFLPNTPGNIGSWQFFCVLGLRLFGVEQTTAAGFSLVGFAVWTLPPILIGAAALVTSPFSWSELRSRRKEAEEIL